MALVIWTLEETWLIDSFDYDISKKIQKFVEWNALVEKSSGYQLNKWRTDYFKKTRRALSTHPENTQGSMALLMRT